MKGFTWRICDEITAFSGFLCATSHTHSAYPFYAFAIVLLFFNKEVGANRNGLGVLKLTHQFYSELSQSVGFLNCTKKLCKFNINLDTTNKLHDE